MSMTPSRRTIDNMTLEAAAADDRLLVVRCSYCRNGDTYRTADLVPVYGPTAHPYGLFHACRHCGRTEWLRPFLRLPTDGDVGQLRIRRPAGVQTILLWEEGWFG
jgi:hypothetical protein